MIPRPEDYPHWIAWRDAVEVHLRDGAPKRGDFDTLRAWADALIAHRKPRDPFADRESVFSVPDTSELDDWERRRALENHRARSKRELDGWYRQAWDDAHPGPGPDVEVRELAAQAGARLDDDGRISFADVGTLREFAEMLVGRDITQSTDAMRGYTDADREYADELYARWERITRYGGQKNARARARRAIDEHCGVKRWSYDSAAAAESTADAVDAEIREAIYGKPAAG